MVDEYHKFKHKNITNPTLLHANKLMLVLSHCTQILKGVGATPTEQELHDMQQIVKVTQANL